MFGAALQEPRATEFFPDLKSIDQISMLFAQRSDQWR
jgi:hypothetical protein